MRYGQFWIIRFAISLTSVVVVVDVDVVVVVRVYLTQKFCFSLT